MASALSPSNDPVTVSVTGAAGQVGYALVHRIAAGEMFGPATPVSLRLLELESAMSALEGVVMELDDGSYPLLESVVATSDPAVVFEGTEWALLVAAMPRKAGQERGDLLRINGGIFRPLGQAIGSAAASNVRILVVGNPCNTNCLIAREAAPDVPSDRWFAMTALDHNRARSMLARRANVPVREVTHVSIWGNHSATQYPDFEHALIGGGPASEVIDRDWGQGEFVEAVQNRGAAIIAARGLSSAASAAKAIIDSVRASHSGTSGDWASLGIISSGQYGVPEGLCFSFPVIADASGWSVVEGIDHGEFGRARIQATLKELQDEALAVADLR